jgi:AhpD family alkylhydroperoxidase
MRNVVAVIPEAMNALQALGKAGEKGGVPSSTLALLELRSSQINGCSVCVDMHTKFMKRSGEKDERIFGVAAWRDMPYYSDAERAALALAECVTRLSDRPDPVPDEVWNEAARHYDEAGLASILTRIVAINAWNRLNVSTRQAAGAWTGEAWKGQGAVAKAEW